MQQPHWLIWLWSVLDKPSLSFMGGTITLASITHWTANGVSAFFTVVLAMTGIVINVVKTKITLRKERERLERKNQGLPPIDEDDD